MIPDEILKTFCYIRWRIKMAFYFYSIRLGFDGSYQHYSLSFFSVYLMRNSSHGIMFSKRAHRMSYDTSVINKTTLLWRCLFNKATNCFRQHFLQSLKNNIQKSMKVLTVLFLFLLMYVNGIRNLLFVNGRRQVKN